MWWALTAIFLGEAVSIYGELRAGKGCVIEGILWGLIGWPLLIYGYWYGVKCSNVWPVTVTSIAAILIMEPLLILLLYKEQPTRNALIGCLLGVAGLIVANVKE